MTLPVVFTANGPSGYNLTKSLRFRSSASAYLNRTLGTPTNQKIWTWSSWIKRGTLDSSDAIFSTSDNYNTLRFSTGSFLIYGDAGGTMNIETTQVFRDPAAWYHFVIAFDSTQATASNRVKLYVNGTQVTAFQTATYPSLNATYGFNSAISHAIGRRQSTSNLYFDGYLAEVNFIDGQQLTPSSFGSTNATTGVWQPSKYTGTYGTNGFYLPFTNTTSTSTLGNDFSGNSNTWTVNNISLTAGVTYDSMTDVPTLTSATTANYCTLNPVDNTGVTITNGNLTATTPASNQACKATMAIPTTGKYYFEVTDVVTGGGNAVGIANVTLPTNTSLYAGTGSIYVSMSSNAVFGLAFNFDALTYTIYKNNSVDSTGSITSGITYIPFMQTSASGGASTAFNFGQQGFKYTPPTGFVALNTYNLPTSTIVKGNTVMDATLYTGTLLSNAITNTAGFKPDLVWIKGRSAATDHKLTDSVRGTTKSLQSNDTSSEGTDIQGLTAFNTNGFTVGTSTNYNNLSATYVGWNWQAGQGSSSSNTSGSITSTVSVNATAGFSIATYTGTGSNATVGHGLGVAPKMIIIKSRSNTSDWVVYNSNLTSASYRLFLQDTSGQDLSTTTFNSTAPTSSVFSIGTNSNVNSSGWTQVAYCWSEIAGFSKFGSYTGNGSTDGTFVYLGFKPKFVITKKSSSTEDWAVLDSSRSPYNVTTADLYPDLIQGEDVGNARADLLSNGIKFRTGGGQWNLNGATYVYMAFAENPFKNALAR